MLFIIHTISKCFVSAPQLMDIHRYFHQVCTFCSKGTTVADKAGLEFFLLIIYMFSLKGNGQKIFPYKLGYS